MVFDKSYITMGSCSETLKAIREQLKSIPKHENLRKRRVAKEKLLLALKIVELETENTIRKKIIQAGVRSKDNVERFSRRSFSTSKSLLKRCLLGSHNKQVKKECQKLNEQGKLPFVLLINKLTILVLFIFS
jgi:hypothetical protein